MNRVCVGRTLCGRCGLLPRSRATAEVPPLSAGVRARGGRCFKGERCGTSQGPGPAERLLPEGRELRELRPLGTVGRTQASAVTQAWRAPITTTATQLSTNFKNMQQRRASIATGPQVSAWIPAILPLGCTDVAGARPLAPARAPCPRGSGTVPTPPGCPGARPGRAGPGALDSSLQLCWERVLRASFRCGFRSPSPQAPGRPRLTPAAFRGPASCAASSPGTPPRLSGERSE